MRKEIRYRLDASALVFWSDAHHMRLRAEGVTRDVSVPGAFIQSSSCPAIDAPVHVEILLSSLMGFKEIRIAGDARVIRVDHRRGSQGEIGFAVVRENGQHWIVAANQDALLDPWTWGLGGVVEVVTH